MSRKLIEMPDGSWAFPDSIASVMLRPARVYSDKMRVVDGLVISMRNGVMHAFDMPGPDEAKAEADRIAALVNGELPE